MKTDSPLSPALQRVRELQEDGHPQRDIVKILQAEGVPLPRGRRQKWNLHGVQAALQQLDALAPAPPPPPPPSIAAVPGPAEVDTRPPAHPLDPSPNSDPSPRPAPLPPSGLPQPIDPNTPPEAIPPHSLTVKILGPWTHADSLFWDYLFRSAWEKIDQKTDHTLPLKDAISNLRTITPRADAEHLWETLDRLAASRVKLESMVAHHPVAISSPLLSAVLTHNALSFHFPPALVTLLKNPQRYTRFRTLFAVKH